LPEQDRVLNIRNFCEFICSTPDEIYLPFNTVSASEEEGLPLVQEREARQLGAMMIMQAAILLRLPSQASACALSIFHRFYYSSSFFECDLHLFSMASLFLAAKLEETPRKYKDVISVFDIVK